MPVTVYKSTDAGAPTLDGSAGSLCNVLDACLVNGYGVKGSAGWTIEFTAANKRVYRPPTGLLRAYLRVQDDAPRAAPFNNANEARLRCYEQATTVDTGVGAFPSTGNGLILQKAQGVGLNSAWIVIADARTVYIFVQSGDYGDGWASLMAGEYYSLRQPQDNYNALAIGNITETVAATPAQAPINENLPKLSTFTVSTVGHYVPRPWGEIGPMTSHVAVGKHGNAAHSSVGLVGLMQYPNPYDNGIYLSQVWIHDVQGLLVRGRMRGFWHQLHAASTLKHGDTWEGTGGLAGKTFMAIGPVPDGLGAFVMEISNTWETN